MSATLGPVQAALSQENSESETDVIACFSYLFLTILFKCCPIELLHNN